MSPTAVKSRIADFEARARQNAQPVKNPPVLTHKSSLIDLTDWVLDDMPPSPTPPQFQLQLASPPKQKPKPKPKPPALQIKRVNKSPPRRSATTDSSASDTSLLYPPLGGREALTGETGRRGNHNSASSVSSFHSVSLSSDTGTDPGTPVANMIAVFPMDRVPTGSSLGESFEEVSIPPTPILHTVAKQKPLLPQRPTTMPPLTTTLPAQHSHTSPPTPTLLPYVPRRVPPPLPTSRASDRSSIHSLSSSATNSGSSASRSSGFTIQTPTLITMLPLSSPSTPIISPSPSILSPSSAMSPSTTSAVLVKSKRPTPVPAAARKRYSAVFNANIIQRRRAENSSISNNKPKKLTHTEAKATRTRQGWRGLSVDLITATPEELELADAKGKERAKDLLSERYVNENVGPDDRLEAGIVKLIWSHSRIDMSKLAEIWSECDPDSKGSLDIDSFVRGMWRIDEHLRRTQAQTSALRNANSTSLTTLRSGLGSLRIKPGQQSVKGLHRSASRSSLGATSLSRSSSTSSRPTGSAKPYADYPPPPPMPKILLR